MKYCLNVLNLMCLCGLLYVLFHYRLEQLEFLLQQANVNVYRNRLDSFQTSHLVNS
jgi:hypothetical protein